MRSSPEARQLVALDGVARIVFFVCNRFAFCLLYIVWFFVCPTSAFTQDAPQTPAPSQPAPQSETKETSSEIAAHDEPTTFRVNVKLVVVRAVVRDSQGHAVGNLHEEDFQVFDKGKPQIITQFDVEQPGVKARAKVEDSGNTPPGAAAPNTQSAPIAPERFVAYMFDDVHLQFGDLVHLREAAERHFATLKLTDRAAIFTTSGLTTLDYTDDRTKLRETLLRLQPHPLMGARHDCPDIGYYQADQIINKNDLRAQQLAIQEARGCESTDLQGNTLGDPNGLVTSVSASVLSAGDQESRVALGSLKEVVHSVSRMPGTRVVVLVSPGFIIPTLEYEFNEIVDRAVRAQVLINTLDARGLYVLIPFGDASHQPASYLGSEHGPPPGKTLIESEAASAQDDLLAALAENTGGVFFHNNNDFTEGFRRAAETPEYSYVLGFVPQNLKLDGSFHSLKVTLKNPQKLTLQARRGYYAPKNAADPKEQAWQEIEDAMYSEEEFHNLPVSMRTQFFKASDEDAKLVVIAHVDVKRLRFRKVEGRNDNVLTCVSVLFNRNGHFIDGTKKIVTMHWKDETLAHNLDSGMNLKTSFDVKPGSYMVRLVVRDAEGQLMSAENGTIEIR
jgi:VWFA-related protein